MTNGIKEKNKRNDIFSYCKKAFTSANINFLIGSGASCPGIDVFADIENPNKSHEFNDFVNEMLEKFKCLNNILENTSNCESCTNKDICKMLESQNNYKILLQNITKLILDRKTELLPTSVNIFTTNYDLFFEEAGGRVPDLLINDGFKRVTGIQDKYKFDVEMFYRSTSVRSNFYDYTLNIPAINLVKLHGSLNWEKNTNSTLINYRNIKKNDSVPNIILPYEEKIQSTVFITEYYDMLRYYSNELDKEHTLLLVFGFSFKDKHILELTNRALRNLSLTIIIFTFDKKAIEELDENLKCRSNVKVYFLEDKSQFTFHEFNKFLKQCLIKNDTIGNNQND